MAVMFIMSRIDQHVGEHIHSNQVDVTPELPAQAVREAIVNAVVHRDCTSSGSVLVMLFKDRLEVWNPGNLPQGMTVDELKNLHRSRPVNPTLANPVYLIYLRFNDRTGMVVIYYGVRRNIVWI